MVPDDLDVFSVLALAVPPLAVHDGCVHIGWGEGVGLVQQRDHTEQDGPERRHQQDDKVKREIKIEESNTGEGKGKGETRGRERKQEVRRDKTH